MDLPATNQKSLYGVCRWAFWRVFYLLRGRPRDLGGFMQSLYRTWWPWKRFQPSVFYNKHGKQWEISFENSMSVTKRAEIPVEIDVDRETGRIVGMTIFEETLNRDWGEA